MRHNSTFRGTAGRKGANPTTGHGSGAWAGLALALAACMVVAAFAAVEPVRPRARLNSISATASAHGASVVLEASEPVAYVTSRPDPLTVLVDLRNATTAGVSNRVATSPAGPVAAVTVEDAVGSDGSAVARIRVLLAAPAQHTVHSDRNVIQVDVVPDDDASPSVRLSASPAAAAPSASPTRSAAAPATRLEAVRTNAGSRSVDVTLAGNGTLVASATLMTQAAPHRLVLDFAGVTPAVPTMIPVAQGAIERVRVSEFSVKPQVTRVVFDLARPVPYAVNAVGNELHVTFTEAPASAGTSPVTAVATRPAASSAAATPQPTPADAAAPPTPARQVDAVATPLSTMVDPQAGARQAQPPLAQAAGSAAAQLLQQGPPGTTRRYTGHPVSLDFQGAELRAVLRTFSEISGLNMVIDPAVQGTVDVALRDVPWDQALESILRSNKLWYAVDGTIIRVAPITVLNEEEEARHKLSDQQALGGEMKVVTKTLNYAQADELAPMLKGNALSTRGSTAVDKRTNTIVINDLPAYLAKAEALLNALDQSEGQVEIEARIVSTSKTFARQLGVKWGFLGQATPELGNTTGASFPNTINGNISVNPSGSTVTLPNTASLVLGSVNGAFNLNAALQALENEGRIKVLLQPRVVTQNNVKARITRGQEIPYTTTIAPPEPGGTGVVIQQPMPTVQFKTAALTLEVTPRITPADTVMLQVDVDNGSAGEVQANGNVAINTQRAQTTVLVQSGATTVIGGIYSSQENRTDYRTPGLGRIPLLRWLFKSESVNDQNEELLIFITPRVMRIK
jgi:type IV pilus assembly protein PilQ